MPGTDHHHHHHHDHERTHIRQPFDENPYVHNCIRIHNPDEYFNTANDCFGPVKSNPGNGTHHRS